MRQTKARPYTSPLSFVANHFFSPRCAAPPESDATRLRTYWEGFGDAPVGCAGHVETTYKWRANDWENNLVGEGARNPSRVSVGVTYIRVAPFFVPLLAPRDDRPKQNKGASRIVNRPTSTVSARIVRGVIVLAAVPYTTPPSVPTMYSNRATNCIPP